MAHMEKGVGVDRYSVTVGARGRVVLPAALRERLGLKEGDKLVLTVQPDGSVKLLSRREAVRRARGLFAHVAPGESLVDELIAERREEARRESEEL
jgi:AbrB family looped-hinge helix DNA binding protein